MKFSWLVLVLHLFIQEHLNVPGLVCEEHGVKRQHSQICCGAADSVFASHSVLLAFVPRGCLRNCIFLWAAERPQRTCGGFSPENFQVSRHRCSGDRADSVPQLFYACSQPSGLAASAVEQDFLKTLQAVVVFVILRGRAGGALIILLCFLCLLTVTARNCGLQ